MHEEHEGYGFFPSPKATSMPRLRALREPYASFVSDSFAAIQRLKLF